MDPVEVPRPLDAVEKDPLERLFKIAGSLLHDRVRVQAIRAIADLTDPVLLKHRLDAGSGDPEIAKRLAGLVGVPFASDVVQEVIIAMGRLRWAGAPAWMQKNRIAELFTFPMMGHAVQQTLRRAGNASAVLDWLEDPPLRPVALRALATMAEPAVADGLVKRLAETTDARARQEYADILTRIHRKAGPWVYWGFRPGPRPANTENWEKTAAIEAALDRVLADPERGVRLAVLRRMQ